MRISIDVVLTEAEYKLVQTKTMETQGVLEVRESALKEEEQRAAERQRPQRPPLHTLRSVWEMSGEDRRLTKR